MLVSADPIAGPLASHFLIFVCPPAVFKFCCQLFQHISLKLAPDLSQYMLVQLLLHWLLPVASHFVISACLPTP
jgi:hypothetical protein